MFISYLWGIETRVACWHSVWIIQFISYLWGIETYQSSKMPVVRVCGLYLTYEELKPEGTEKANKMEQVYILPMRNWNQSFLHIIFRLQIQFISYLWGIETRTWWRKHRSVIEFISYLWGIETVPTRLRLSGSWWFISYLWGIETKIGKKLNQRVSYVYILPMRNWNKLRLFVCFEPFHEFISYLWGIETAVRD